MKSWLSKATEVKKYSERELKVHLKTCLIRLGLRKTKSKNNIQRSRKDISVLLSKGDDENARILVEQIIKEEYRGEAFEELTVMCEELQARLGVITTTKRLPMDLKENICTIIWAAPQVDVKEFGLIRQQLALKYGLNLDHEATCNIDNCVNQKVIELLSPNPPEEVLVFSYLKEIANEYKIDWKPEELNLPSELPQAQGEDDELKSRLQSLTSMDDLDNFDEPKFPEVHQNLTAHTLDSPDIGRASAPIQLAKDNLDEFESMFAPIPQATIPVPITVQTTPVAIQKIQPITPQRNLQTVQPIQIAKVGDSAPLSKPIQLSKVGEPSSNALADLSALQPGPVLAPIKVDLAASRTPGTPLFISDKELEDEFEKMFGSAMSDLEKQPATPTPSPVVSTPAVVAPAAVSASGSAKPLSFQQDATAKDAGNSEYSDLFSAPPIAKSSLKPQGGVKLPGLGDIKPLSKPAVQQVVPEPVQPSVVVPSTINSPAPSLSDIDADYSNLFDRLQTLNQNSGKPAAVEPVVPQQFSSVSFGKYARDVQPSHVEAPSANIASSVTAADLDKFSAFPFDTPNASIPKVQAVQPSPFEVAPPQHVPPSQFSSVSFGGYAQNAQPSRVEIASVTPADLDNFSAFPFDTPQNVPKAAPSSFSQPPPRTIPSVTPADLDQFSAFPFETPNIGARPSNGAPANLDQFSAFPFPTPSAAPAPSNHTEDDWAARFNDPFSKLAPSFTAIPQEPIQPNFQQTWNQPEFGFNSTSQPTVHQGISLNKTPAPAAVVDEDDELLRRFALLSGKR